MKTLITEKCVREFIEKGQKSICIDDNTLITPAARDMIRANGIELTEGCAPAAGCCTPAAPAAQTTSAAQPACEGDGLSSNMIYQVLKKLADQGLLDGFVNSLNAASGNAPYTAECENGLKLVRGQGIKMEVLDTGVPADYGKVMYQEIVGADDGASVASGFMTVDHCTFDYPVEIQETHYVVEGQMTITIDGKEHTAYPGDTFFIQKGQQVRFSSGDTFAKTFYATY